MKISEIGAVAPGTGRAFDVEGYSIAVFNLDGTLYAIDDSCPHQGSSLAMGTLDLPFPRDEDKRDGRTAARTGNERPHLSSPVTLGWPLYRFPDGVVVSARTNG